MKIKIITALIETFKKKDTTSMEHLEKNRIRSTIEGLCNKYLVTSDAILEFEASKSALPYVVSILEEPLFLEKYDFMQMTESLFQMRMKEINLM